MTFESGNSYDLSNPDLQYFITNTQFDKPIKNWGPIYNFLKDMKFDLNYGDKKSIRYQFIKELYSHYQLQGYAQTHDLQCFAQRSSQSPTHPQSSMGNTQENQLQSYVGSQSGSQLGSGLNGESYREYSQLYIFLPSDPDELVDQLKLFYFEKVGGIDSFLINEQTIASIDKLLEYECISPSQHQNMRSNWISSQSPSIT